MMRSLNRLRRSVALFICPELGVEERPMADSVMTYEHLITLAKTLSDFIDRSEATLSNRIVGHARLFSRLRDGRGCNAHTYTAALQWFSDYWPDDLEWPSEIPRPSRKSIEEGAA